MGSVGCPLIGDGMYRHPLYGQAADSRAEASAPGEERRAGESAVTAGGEEQQVQELAVTADGAALPPGDAARLAQIAELDAAIPRQALHAVRLAFRHPVTHAELVFEAPLPPDMALLQEKLRQSAR